MRAGISLRQAWLESWDKLELSRFNFFEIVPFTDSGLFERDIAKRSIAKCGDAEIWQHITTTSSCDTEEFFRERIETIADILSDAQVTGISIHFALQHHAGRYLPQPFPVFDDPLFIDRTVANLELLKTLFPGKRIAIENISTGIKSTSSRNYLDIFERSLDVSGAEVLLDFSNLWNSCQNLDEDFFTLAKRYEKRPIAYLHVGGSFRHGSSWLDAHNEFALPPDLKAALSAMSKDIPLVYEHDFALNDLSHVKTHLDEFYNYVQT